MHILGGNRSCLHYLDSLSHMWETQAELLAPGACLWPTLALMIMDIWGVNPVDKIYVSVFQIR